MEGWTADEESDIAENTVGIIHDILHSFLATPPSSDLLSGYYPHLLSTPKEKHLK